MPQMSPLKETEMTVTEVTETTCPHTHTQRANCTPSRALLG